AARADRPWLRAIPYLQPRADRGRHFADDRAVAGLRAHSLRRANSRVGRQPADGAVARRRRRAPLHDHVRHRQRPRGGRRGPGRRDPRSRSELTAALPRLLPDRRRGRRPGPRDRSVFRRAADRRVRFRAENLFSEGWHDLHLCTDAGAAAVAAAGPVREEGVTIDATQALARRHHLRWWEALPWVAGIAMFFAFPTYLAFGTQLLITILFA